MSCGKTVLMSKTKGIFNKQKLKNMKNIVFLKLIKSIYEQKIKLLLNDKSLRKKLEKTAEIQLLKFYYKSYEPLLEKDHN